jgi:hypothetical protein
MNGFNFKCMEEIFGTRIVVAIALAAHGTHESMFAEQRLRDT